MYGVLTGDGVLMGILRIDIDDGLIEKWETTAHTEYYNFSDLALAYNIPHWIMVF
jgi:hypothetical protein